MRALTYAGFGEPLRVVDLAPPTVPPGGAVVAVERTGLCRSDWHGWLGHDDDIVSFPHVPGHEFAGTVLEVGVGVDPGWVGRPVTAPFVFACGRCPTCAEGQGQVCPDQTQPGFTHPGSFAERVCVRAAATNLVPLPEGLPPGLAAGLGCRVATAYRAVTARAGVRAGEWVLVQGCGGVGLAAVMAARARGGRVVAVDVAQHSLERAAALGAEHVVLAGGDGRADASLAQQVVDLTDGGVHVSLDCLGSPQTARDGVLSLRRRGRHMQVGLLPAAVGRTDLPMGRVIAWELDVLGSHGMSARDYPALLADVAAGRVDLTRLLAPGPPLSLEEAAVALPGMGQAASSGIVLIDPLAG